MYMKPGYLLPVFDLESGNSMSHSGADAVGARLYQHDRGRQGHQPDRLHQQFVQQRRGDRRGGIHQHLELAAHRAHRTYQWLARPSGNLQTGTPVAASGYPDPYGGWDPNFTTQDGERRPGREAVGVLAERQRLAERISDRFQRRQRKHRICERLPGPGAVDQRRQRRLGRPSPTGTATTPAAERRRPARHRACQTALDWVKLQNSGGGTVTISSGAQAFASSTRSSRSTSRAASLSIGYVPGSGGKLDLPSEFNAAVTLSEQRVLQRTHHASRWRRRAVQHQRRHRHLSHDQPRLACVQFRQDRDGRQRHVCPVDAGRHRHCGDPIHRCRWRRPARSTLAPRLARSRSTTARRRSTSRSWRPSPAPAD